MNHDPLLSHSVKATFSAVFVSLLVSCGPIQDGDNQSRTIGGTVSGLSDSGTLSVQNNVGDVLTISENGPYSFTIPINELGDYAVSTVTQPSNPDQICMIENATGSVSDANVTNIDIVCTTTQFELKGTVTGLATNGNLALQNNEGDDITVTENGNFAFPTMLDHLSPFEVTILSQPTSQTCTIDQPSGNIESTSLIEVVCTTDEYFVGGTIAGLSETGILVLQNNSADDLTITENGSFSFPIPLNRLDDYLVTVLTEPSSPNQLCSIDNASGSIESENISNISVTCLTEQYTVGGTISNLSGTGLILQNNLSDDLEISANGSFTFTTPIDDLSAYSVTVLAQPDSPNQFCRTSNHEGTISGADYEDVLIDCSSKLYVSTDGLNSTDNGTGTRDIPFKTISAAISFASTLGAEIDIHVAEGTYEIDSSGDTGIVMVEGVSLYGGYDSINWDNRDPTGYPSIITDIATGSTNQTIYFDEGITEATVVDGFTINGGNSANYTYAIYINMSSPTISNNIINANGSGLYSYAIKNFNGSPVVFNNVIDGGMGTSATYGINNQTTGTPIAYNNRIDAGSGSSFSFGISGSGGGTTTAYNNVIFGGDSASITHAIRLEGAYANLYNNTLSGGSGSSYSHAIKLKSASTAVLSNNILFTEGGIYRYCILENGGSEENNVTVLSNNNLFNCSTALYRDNFRDVTLNDITAIETELMTEGFVAADNTSQDPGFVNTATQDWHLDSNSPCGITTGGKDDPSSLGLDDDIEGTTRTGDGTSGWSMGAYEYDGSCFRQVDVYVSTDHSNASDSGSGSQSIPFKTISAAISFASRLDAEIDIHVAEGTYNIDSSGDTGIVMVEGVSLYGGYDSINWDNRDPTNYPSIITDTATGSTNQTIYFDEGITEATVVDGFTINGGNSANYTYAIYINMSSPTISNNIINANGSGLYSYAIKNFNGSPVVFNNVIDGGMGTSATYGINNQTTGTPIAYNNRIDAGSGSSFSFGISGSGGGTTTAYNNVIFGGDSASITHAIRLEGAYANLYNNTLSGGSGSSYSHAIKLKSASTAVLSNNILFTEGGIYRYCILENGGSEENNVTVLSNNNLFNCSTALYRDNFRDVTLNDITAIETELTTEGFVAADNTSQDPGFVNTATQDWHLDSNSPCGITTGGKDDPSSLGLDEDIEGTTRTGDGTSGWSMGAYEYDGTCQ